MYYKPMARNFIIKTQYKSDGSEVLKTQTAMSRSFGKLATNLVDKNSAISRSFGKVNQAINRVAMIGLTALVATFGLATKNYVAFQSAMAKVETIADSTTLSFEKQRKKMLELSNSLGLDVLELAEAQYQAISAGVTDSAKALDFVATSSKAAIGGFTDTATAVDGLTSILNAYGMATEDATRISDQLLATQNFGKTTFADMAQSMGGTIPIAAALAVKTEELFGAVGALTKVGIQTPEAFVGIKAALSNILKPSEQASKLAKQLGVDFSSTALKTKGLQKFLEDAAKATGGSEAKMATLFGSVRALNTVLALTKDSSKVFKEGIVAVTNSAGATQSAFEKMTDTVGFKFEKLKVRIFNTLVEIGETIEPFVTQLLDEFDKLDLTAFITKFQEIDFTPFMEITASIKDFFMFLGDHWETLLSFAAAIKGVSIALGILTIAVQVFGVAIAATPVGMIIAAVGILVGLFTKLVLEAGGVKNAFILIGRTIMGALLSPVNILLTAYAYLLELLSFLPGKAGSAFGQMSRDVKAMQDTMNKALTGSESSLTIGTEIGGKDVFNPVLPTADNGAITPTPASADGIGVGRLDININNQAGDNATIEQSRTMPIGTNFNFKPVHGL